MKPKTILLAGLLLLAGYYRAIAQKHISFFHHPPGRYVLVNGAHLWIEEEGHGTPLFLIAGGPGDAHAYMHSFDPLKDTALLVFIDGFGRGKSDTAKNVKEYSIARDVSDVEGLRKALGFGKINVLGHSYGSVVAQLYAIKYGSHVKHLIIADGIYSAKMWQEADDNANYEISEIFPAIWHKLTKLRAEGFRSSDSICYNLYSKALTGFLKAYNPDNLTNYFRSIDLDSYPNSFNWKLYYQIVGPDGDFKIGNDAAKFDVTKSLKYLKMPVLILAGRYDRVSVPKFSVLYKKYCPQATFVMFKHSGHFPEIEEPKKTFSVVRRFLDEWSLINH